MTKELWICLIALAVLIGCGSSWAYHRFRQRPDVIVSDGPAEYFAQRASTATRRTSWVNTYTTATNYEQKPFPFRIYWYETYQGDGGYMDTGRYVVIDPEKGVGPVHYAIRGSEVTQTEYERFMRSVKR